ncbi:MAG: M15 family metallopeptidase, partial [Mycobacteriales bacterium]
RSRLRPDVLVRGSKPLSSSELHRVAALAPGAVAFASGTVRLGSTPVHVASVDPASFRRYAAAGTAESTAVWQTVAQGDVVVSHALAQHLRLQLGKDLPVRGRQALTLRLGALATTGIPGTDLLVDTATGRRLGLVGPTALLLSAGKADPTSLASRVRRITGDTATVDLLTAPAASPVAFLTGSRAAKAFGAFSYTYFPDGTIAPDEAWVRANIVTTTVPILGTVTCHRLMIPQLRGALQDVVRAGLASSLHTYDGCYVPRFIEHDPSHAISLHTWGIAIDLDAASNYRGIKGTMDPRVVDIFKRWGFRWGGDWSYTDPMHFEIGALLTSPR